MSVKRPRSDRPADPASGPKGSRRARYPQGQGGRLRDDLIEAADRILSRTGDVEGLALRAVAREAGIATPSIYLHFPDKQALVRAVLEVRFRELADAVRAAVATESGPAGCLRAGALAYCQFATDHPNAYRVLFGRVSTAPTPSNSPATGEEARDDGPSDRAQATPPAAFGFLVEGVAGCMRAGIAPERDPVRVATNVWTALHGIVTLRRSVPAFTWPPLSEQVDDVLSAFVGLDRASLAREVQG
jgi:AcrR family transcriptional regulator